MIDVSTKYLGLNLNGPIVVSSTPLSESIENVRRMEDAGASAIVLTSLFEEQLSLESRTLDEDLSRGTESFAESLGYLPDLNDYRMTHEVYLEHIRRCKEAVRIPILASLNGATTGGWVRFARESEQAGTPYYQVCIHKPPTSPRPTPESNPAEQAFPHRCFAAMIRTNGL
jgi:dihydroorotate dehydrogenase (fumarate)